MAGLTWSIALAAIGIFGLWLAGSQRPIGWAVGLGAQALWIVFALVTGQYGFIASAVAYGVVYLRNWRRAQKRRTVQIRLVADTAGYQAALRRAAGHTR